MISLGGLSQPGRHMRRGVERERTGGLFGDEIKVTIEKLSDTERKITIEGAEIC